MFKIIPIIVSVALAGAGGLAVSHMDAPKAPSSANIQALEASQNSFGISPQDSSNLFINADSNIDATVSAPSTAQLQSSADINANDNMQSDNSLQVNI